MDTDNLKENLEKNARKFRKEMEEVHREYVRKSKESELDAKNRIIQWTK